ncbi:MAG: hypothetical protein WBG57_05480 [Ornithinimicrobium sp.]
MPATYWWPAAQPLVHQMVPLGGAAVLACSIECAASVELLALGTLDLDARHREM